MSAFGLQPSCGRELADLDFDDSDFLRHATVVIGILFGGRAGMNVPLNCCPENFYFPALIFAARERKDTGFCLRDLCTATIEIVLKLR